MNRIVEVDLSQSKDRWREIKSNIKFEWLMYAKVIGTVTGSINDDYKNVKAFVLKCTCKEEINILIHGYGFFRIKEGLIKDNNVIGDVVNQKGKVVFNVDINSYESEEKEVYFVTNNAFQTYLVPDHGSLKTDDIHWSKDKLKELHKKVDLDETIWASPSFITKAESLAARRKWLLNEFDKKEE